LELEGTFRKLKKFNASLDFKDITLSFYDGFTTWLFQNGLRVNTVGKHIKMLKMIMRMAQERDLHNNTDYTKDYFKVVSEEGKAELLTFAEVAEIYHTKVSPGQQAAKDLFIALCVTGQRPSDLSKLIPENEKKGVLVFEQQKTGTKVRIPITPILREIWERYEGGLPVLSAEKINRGIKKIGHKLWPERFPDVLKGLRCSDARRSFSTNLYDEIGMARPVMAATGHKTESSFMIYIRRDYTDVTIVGEVMSRNFMRAAV